MGKCSKDKRDMYYRKAKELGYRARSAFKLIQLDEEFDLFKDVTRVVDLCAAPGGWSQVISQRLYGSLSSSSTEEKKLSSDIQIIAVDLMEMAPIDHVIQLQGDITSERTLNEIISQFHGQGAQIVVSDGAPDVLGLHDIDEYLQAQLVLAALNISLHILEDGGTFVAKIFRGKDVSLLYAQLQTYFKQVICAKPKASRNSSFEAFVVCRQYKKQSNSMKMKPYLLDYSYNNQENQEIGPMNRTVPFRACGGIHAWDSDQSYPIDESEGYIHREPLQKPINPPYAKSLSFKEEIEKKK